MTSPKTARPATASAVNGPRDDDRFAGEIVTTIPSIKAPTQQSFVPTQAIPVVTGIRRRSYGKPAWLVTIEGVCNEEPIRDRKLHRYRRFCAAIEWRFGVTFHPMSQADWLAILEKAIAADGGAS
ncbi:hypothetical protein [Bradyrhizobium sp. JYMT SZCCT0180]|uniref:hypothetical protein n=1 Tax=Bradyrhizobium sp. JYMT SZCCT0180 TaxID=2807666 RepID=UPI001BA4C22B|nr:hypothetical protein [Bradyrhizobium sp. JYMT SZCCT0180]MBR1216199.1 hypothetical protein [Bradyrhizobium sp. JYMT SZCCT0180]